MKIEYNGNEAKITLKQVQTALDEANKLFNTDYRLMGSWRDKGYSNNDIDLYSESDEYTREWAVGYYIAVKTKMLVEFHPIQWRMYQNDLNNHVRQIYPGGECGTVMGFINDMEYLDNPDPDYKDYTQQTFKLTDDKKDKILNGIIPR